MRAAFLVQRLVREDELRPGFKVLVVGAGVAGVETAIGLCHHGINVIVIDQSKEAFALQKSSKTRWLDPCQYDWPRFHFDTGTFPIEGTAVFLKWKADYSINIAAKWQFTFNWARSKYEDQLDIIWRCTRFDIESIEEDRFAIRLHPIGVKEPKSTTVDAIIFATGSGYERHMLDDSKSSGFKCMGPAFWGNDSLNALNLGKTNPPTALIMGGGDGALQDFLRITTGIKSAKDIYKALDLPKEVLHAAHDIESQFHRSLIWMNNRDQDHPVYLARQNSYNSVIDAIWPRLNNSNKLTSLVRKDVKAVYLAYPCNHFTVYYGLNCFLALLVARAWQKHHDKFSLGRVLRPWLKAKDCQPTYLVDDEKESSDNKPYEITFRREGCKGTERAAEKISADVLVPRFGIIKPKEVHPLWPGAEPIHPDRTRHIFPYLLYNGDLES